MPGLNQTGPVGLGSMTGRRKGNCISSDNTTIDNKIKNTIFSLAAALIIGLAERVWNKIEEKRLKSGKQ